ncbi:MAG: NnrS family protein [Burkholderiales bacterium]|nr:NnrS family protein [Burkholderiales bacterium]
MATLLRIDPPGDNPPPAGFALWRLGFRPFYLGAGLFAAASVLLWTAQHAGWIRHAYLDGALWHAHEMLFGFTLAVVVGFLFTAGHNWSGRPTPTGPLLAALAALWLAARILVLTPWGWAAAAANTAFPVACAIALAVPLVAAGNRRNYFFIALLGALGAASAGVHLAHLGVLSLPPWLGIQLALDLVLFIMAVMTGRVMPMFTNNGVPGAGAERHDALEKLALAAVLALLAADLLRLDGEPLAVAAIVAAGAHALRWALWRPWRTLGKPIVWVLHAATLWIPIHLALRAGAALGIAPANLAAHALAIGAIGGLTIGMMTRTARGHTGRVLAADAAEVTCYLLVQAAALVRVGVPLVAPGAYLASVQVSGLLWSAGFALFALRYWPILTRPRVDGRPG